MMTEADLERTDKKADAADQYVVWRFHFKFYVVNRVQ